MEALPAERRECARAALEAAFGAGAAVSLAPLAAGASGASLYKVEASHGCYALRVEAARGPLRNPHAYACMQIAAEAGVAPRLVHVDADAGIAIMSYVRAQPLAKYPGGPKALAAGLGRLVARLHAAPRFPALHDYPTLLARLIDALCKPDFFAAGLLAPHRELFERIREAFPWGAAALVSSHNDPNPHNVLFDGERLWLVDWETACANEPLIDVAILAESFAPSPELEGALLEGWSGRPADEALRARVLLLRLLSRLYYAGLLLGIARARAARAEPDRDLAAPTEAELGALAAQGRLDARSPDTLYMLGKVMLARFVQGGEAPALAEALAAVRTGVR